jgi:hypothetical protein
VISTYPATEEIAVDIGLRHFIIPCEEGGHRWWLWWHDCPTPSSGHVSWNWIGNNGSNASGHKIESIEPLTVSGSLICTDCGDHGFICDGRWIAA